MQWRMGLAETVEMLRMPRPFGVIRLPNHPPSTPLISERAKPRTHCAAFSRSGRNGIRRHLLGIR
jgi:hypothetical protein